MLYELTEYVVQVFAEHTHLYYSAAAYTPLYP